MKFSANLGFLWSDRSLPEAIRAAARAGFGWIPAGHLGIWGRLTDVATAMGLVERRSD